MASKWYYCVTDNRYGPVSSSELKALAEGGRFKPSDAVWKEGLPNWVKASSIKGLFAANIQPLLPPPLPAAVGAMPLIQ
jgi:hypothetical protein